MTKPALYIAWLVALPLTLLPGAWTEGETAVEKRHALKTVLTNDQIAKPQQPAVSNSPYGEIITLCTDGACDCTDETCKPEAIAKTLVYHLLDIEGPVKKVLDDFMTKEGCILTETGYRYDTGPDSFSCPRIDLSELLKLRSGRAGWMYQSISRLAIVRLVELGSASNTFPIMALTICQEMKSEKVSDDNYQTTLATRVCGFDPSRFSLPHPSWSDAGKKSMAGKALKHRLDAMEEFKHRRE